MKKYIAVLKYKDQFVESYLSNYFEDIKFMYVINEDTYNSLVNPQGKVKIKVKDYDLTQMEVIETAIKEDREVILVGLEALKFMFRRSSGIQKFSGNLLTDDVKDYGDKFSCWVLADPSIIQLYPYKEKQVIKDINKIKNGEGVVEVKAIIPEDDKQADNILKSLMNSDILAVDTETESLIPIGKDVLGVCLANSENEGYYIPIEMLNIQLFKEVLRTAKKIVMHNAKFDCNKLRQYVPEIDELVLPKLEDTMILEYLINENSSHGLKEMALKYTRLGNYDDLLDKEKKKYCKKYKIKVSEFSYKLLPKEILGEYGAKDAIATLQVYNIQKDKIGKQVNEELYKKLIEISIYLGHIEQNGGIIDLDKFQELENEYKVKIAKLVMEMNEEAEKYGFIDLNYNSPKQLAELLFDYMGFKPVRYTDSGHPSTDDKVLQTLLKDNPNNKFLKNLVEYRKVTKLYSTYIKPVPQRMVGNKIYPSFNITGTTSGRLSSNNPNFQNLPKSMRQLYIGSEEYPLILQIDLKNAELWVAGFLANERVFLDAFKHGIDLHGKMAKLLFNLDCEPNEAKEKYPEQRQLAKTINFLILYGGSAKKLSMELGINQKDAQRYIDLFFQSAPNIKKWIDEHKAFLLENGYLVSYFGRIRHLPEVWSSNQRTKAHAIRSGINFLIQSVASDIITFSIPNIMRQLKDKCEIFTLVHDSIVMRTKEEYIDEIVEIIGKELQSRIPNVDPPIGYDVEIGKNWYELKEYKKGE